MNLIAQASARLNRQVLEEREARLLSINAAAEGPCCSVPMPVVAISTGGADIYLPLEPSYVLPGRPAVAGARGPG